MPPRSGAVSAIGSAIETTKSVTWRRSPSRSTATASLQVPLARYSRLNLDGYRFPVDYIHYMLNLFLSRTCR